MADWTPDDWYVRNVIPLPPLEDGSAWQEHAVCAQTDPEAFFPSHNKAGAQKIVCAGCPVRNECLEYALTNDERFGIWGGMQPYEREHLLGRRISKVG